MITDKHKHFLLPRFDTIGDIVLLQGFIAHLQNNVPDSTVSLLVREGYDQLAPLFPANIRWLTTGLQAYREFSDSDQKCLDDLLKLLDTEIFDCLLITTFTRTWIDDLVAAKLSAALRIAIGDSCARLAWADALHDRLGLPTTKLYDRIVPVIEASREIEKYQILADIILPCAGELPLPRLTVPNSIRESTYDLLGSISLSPGAYYACVVTCTATISIKSWPAERFVDVMVRLQQEYALKPLIVGHVSEQYKIESVMSLARAKGIEPAIWLGETGELALLAGLLQQSRFYVGNDTGPMHIAASLGVATVAIFGGGNWPRFLPVGARAIGIAGELPCFGCSWLNCIFGDAPCVRIVRADDVLKAIHQVLAERLPETNYFPLLESCGSRLEELFQRFATGSQVDCRKFENEVSELRDEMNLLQLPFPSRIAKPLRNLKDWIRKWQK
jgi:ADP-heptose:LPS heptosyltransferase